MTESLLHEPQAETQSLLSDSVTSSSEGKWLSWFGFALLFSAFIWLYLPTFRWLLSVWSYDEYYGHGPFLPFISAYLIWQKRVPLLQAWAQRSPGSIVPSGLIFLALIVQTLGSFSAMSSVRALYGFSIPIFLLGAARYLGGKSFARPLVFPLLFLWLAVPVSGPLVGRLTIPLQTYAASASAMLLGLLGMPIQREGINLYTPLYHFVVAVPCSGLKTGITLFTMGVLISHLMANLTLWQRIGLSALSLPIALTANTLRVMTIVSLGFHFGTKTAEGFLHEWSGIFMFGLSLTALLSLGSYLSHGSRTAIKPSNAL